MADEESRDVVIVGEQLLELGRRRRLILGGLCVALLCALVTAIYAGMQLWTGTWALERVSPITWIGVFGSTLLSAVFIRFAWDTVRDDGWRALLLGITPVAAGIALVSAVYLYGISRVLGCALIASPLLVAVGGWILWRRVGVDPEGPARPEERPRS
jgi:hypothetical protein